MEWYTGTIMTPLPIKPILIGIAGPSGAGKSVACRRILAEFTGVTRLKFDDFFHDEKDVRRHPMGYVNWDDPSSIKWSLLVQALAGLRAGKSVIIPRHDRAINKQRGTKQVDPNRIILVDGYQVLYDPHVRAHLDMSLYFDLPEGRQLDRRIARQPDVDRGYLYHVMIPAAKAFLYPTRRYATHVVDASQTPEQVYTSVLSHLSGTFDKIGLQREEVALEPTPIHT